MSNERSGVNQACENKMDPWKSPSSDINVEITNNVNFEDNFKPTISHTLPDSKQYLQSLENKLDKLRKDANIIKQLEERREACMRTLLQGDRYFDDNHVFETPVCQSAILRAIAPDRQALTNGEVVELVKHEILTSRLEEESDASR